jgi:hypothetical protein
MLFQTFSDDYFYYEFSLSPLTGSSFGVLKSHDLMVVLGVTGETE